MPIDFRYFKFREHALGLHPADLVLKNCRLVNVLSGRIEERVTIAVSGSRVIGLGDYRGAEVVDVKGQFVYPGLMDAHMHIESSKLTIPQLARLFSRNGTTSIFADPHEIANVASIEGVSYLLDTAAHNERVSAFFTVPSCVPAIPDPQIETFAAYLGPTKLRTFFNNPWFVVLGEMMNMPGAIYGDEKVLRKLSDFRAMGVPIDGHAPLLGGRELNAYIYLGIRSDHESTSAAEALEKLDRGMHVMIREGSSESNLRDLLPIVNNLNSGRIMFATDDIDPIDLVERGHINYILRVAVEAGLDPIRAIQMATINTASYFGQRELGAIFPGARADMVISPDLKQFVPTSVIRAGKFVFRDGEEVQVGRDVDRLLRSMMNVSLPEESALQVKPQGSKMRAIKIIENQIVTEEIIIEPTVERGLVEADPERDIAKICVFERHRNSGSFSIGFIKGLGLRSGAIGSSVSHDAHNIIVAGMDDHSILKAAQIIEGMQGGQIAVSGNGEARIPLPIAGLMSELPFEEVVAQEKKLTSFCHEVLGSPLHSPVTTLSFMSLPVIPLLRITDKGMIRIDPGQYPRRVPVFVD
jgi:adenine deaminase